MHVEIEVRTLKCDATQPIIRYWLSSGPNNFVSCLTEFWNLSFSELWILQSYWIPLKTEFWLNSFKSELSQIWPFMFYSQSWLTRAPLGYFYNAPHWGGGAISSPLLISETTGPILKIGGAWRHSDDICGRTMIPWNLQF